MKRISLLIGSFILVASIAQAQAATTTFNAPDNAPTVAVAQALIYNLYVNNSVTPVVITAVTCTGAVPFACTGTVPASVPTIIGTKYELSAKDSATGTEGPKTSVPFIMAPRAPTNLKVQ